ncbi:unnamed protein product [Vitrella brassicaformis CCMP3155]|uniref:AP2/ERF domain-containing protein n=2 Tax=Vitrella brassicaformis TaxID=1169539 RepID=A0A0G4G445_VITBC|nr:unnamed protein product [Vitrella brassicaformis CCMP3155]|eukprot:CEM22666.1 unnamed protein product [Vitrella brassicaformis CCMP3155]
MASMLGAVLLLVSALPLALPSLIPSDPPPPSPSDDLSTLIGAFDGFLTSPPFPPDVGRPSAPRRASGRTQLEMAKKMKWKFRNSALRNWHQAIKREQRELEWIKENGPPEVKWWTSGKGLHPWRGKSYASNLQNKYVNWAMPYRKLDEPFYGMNYTVITKAQAPYDVSSPFVKRPNATKRRRYRMRRPADPAVRSATRRERMMRNYERRLDLEEERRLDALAAA